MVASSKTELFFCLQSKGFNYSRKRSHFDHNSWFVEIIVVFSPKVHWMCKVEGLMFKYVFWSAKHHTDRKRRIYHHFWVHLQLWGIFLYDIWHMAVVEPKENSNLPRLQSWLRNWIWWLGYHVRCKWWLRVRKMHWFHRNTWIFDFDWCFLLGTGDHWLGGNNTPNFLPKLWWKVRKTRIRK